MFDCTEQAGRKACRSSNVTLFEDLDQYSANYVGAGFSDLVLANFRFVFLYYGLFGALILVVAFLPHLVQCVRKRIEKRLNRKEEQLDAMFVVV